MAVAVADGLELARHAPAVKRERKVCDAAEKLGIRALLGKAVRVCADVGAHCGKLPLMQKDRVLEALGRWP